MSDFSPASDRGSEPEKPSPLARARPDALANLLTRSEAILDEEGMLRLRGVGLRGQLLDCTVADLVEGGRAELVVRGSLVVLQQCGDGS